jgi:hypothetical protein
MQFYTACPIISGTWSLNYPGIYVINTYTGRVASRISVICIISETASLNYPRINIIDMYLGRVTSSSMIFVMIFEKENVSYLYYKLNETKSLNYPLISHECARRRCNLQWHNVHTDFDEKVIY